MDSTQSGEENNLLFENVSNLEEKTDAEQRTSDHNITPKQGKELFDPTDKTTKNTDVTKSGRKRPGKTTKNADKTKSFKWIYMKSCMFVTVIILAVLLVVVSTILIMLMSRVILPCSGGTVEETNGPKTPNNTTHQLREHGKAEISLEVWKKKIFVIPNSYQHIYLQKIVYDKETKLFLCQQKPDVYKLVCVAPENVSCTEILQDTTGINIEHRENITDIKIEIDEICMNNEAGIKFIY